MAPSIYYYRMTTDNGGAPCVDNGLWSLAICKPVIRKVANEGDLIVGFAGNAFGCDNAVVHIARVTTSIPDGGYYQNSQFHSRPDCIYRCEEKVWTIVPNDFHSESDMDRDLGVNRDHAHVLLSEDFRYFGNQPFPVDWQKFPNLRKALDALGVGHRVNHLEGVRKELEEVVKGAFNSRSLDDVGAPTHAQNCPCNRGDEESIGVC